MPEQDLLERLERLERRNQRLESRLRFAVRAWAITGVAIVGLLTAIRPGVTNPQDLQARSLTIVDEQGQKRIFVGMDRLTHWIGSAENVTPADLAMPAIRLTNREGDPGISLLMMPAQRTGPDGKVHMDTVQPRLNIRDARQMSRVIFELDSEGTPSLNLYGVEDSIASLGITPPHAGDHGELRIMKNEKVIYKAP